MEIRQAYRLYLGCLFWKQIWQNVDICNFTALIVLKYTGHLVPRLCQGTLFKVCQRYTSRPSNSIFGFLNFCILIHRKQVPLLHNTVLILCDEGAGLVAVKRGPNRDRLAIGVKEQGKFLHITYKSMLGILNLWLLSQDLSIFDNTVDPDQLASDDAIWSWSTMFLTLLINGILQS